MAGKSYAFGLFRLDPAGLLWRDGRPVPLGRRGVLLLEALLSHRGEVVSRDDLMDAAWPDEAVEVSNLSVQIAKLRKAVGSDWIRTVERVGYQFVDAAEGVPVAARRRGNLDRMSGECVLRDDEIAAVARLVMAHRVTSVVGPAGVGKTTLALAVAKQLEPAFPDGVWVIDLAALTNVASLESAVIEALGITARTDVSPGEAIARELLDKNALLVLDNCEHVADAVTAVLVGSILAGGHEVKVLASTQVPLGLAEEHLFKLAPFGFESRDRDSQAIQFVAHCYAAQGETLERSERSVVDQLCREFDGLALPLKLVAAQAAIIGLAAVEQQLHRGRDAVATGRNSVRGSMDWSYRLLTKDGQRVFRALGVFQGGFKPAAATEVAGAAADAELTELVRRSIVVRHGVGKGRFRLLEPFRLFALELLAEAGEEPEARRRHARFVADFFRRGLDLWQTMRDDEWVDLHRPESANLRAALEWAEKAGDWDLFSRLAAASSRYWFETGLPRETYARCETALVSTPAMDDETRAIMTVCASEYVGWQTPALAALLDLDWAIAHLTAERIRPFRVQALFLKGEALEIADKPQLARPLFDEADALVAGMPDSKLKARILVAGAMSRWTVGDREIARTRIDAGLAMHAAFRNASGFAYSAIYAAENLHRDGDIDEAIALCMQTLPYFREHASILARGALLTNLTSYLLAAGRLDDARNTLDEALPMSLELEPMNLLCLVQSVAEVSALEGELAKAALLVGFVDHGLGLYSGGRQITEQRQLNRILDILAAGGMGEEKLERLRSQGVAMSPFEAHRLAGMA